MIWQCLLIVILTSNLLAIIIHPEIRADAAIPSAAVALLLAICIVVDNAEKKNTQR